MQGEDELENSDMIGVVKIKDGLFICDEPLKASKRFNKRRLQRKTM